MMKLPTKFSVSREIAVRCGVYEGRYVTADGRSLVDSHDLKSLRMEPEEYVTGIDARIITDEEFRLLRDDGGKRLGMDVLADEGSAEEPQPAEPDVADDESESEAESESVSEEEGKDGES